MTTAAWYCICLVVKPGLTILQLTPFVSMQTLIKITHGLITPDSPRMMQIPHCHHVNRTKGIYANEQLNDKSFMRCFRIIVLEWTDWLILLCVILSKKDRMNQTSGFVFLVISCYPDVAVRHYQCQIFIFTIIPVKLLKGWNGMRLVSTSNGEMLLEKRWWGGVPWLEPSREPVFVSSLCSIDQTKTLVRVYHWYWHPFSRKNKIWVSGWIQMCPGSNVLQSYAWWL